MNIILKISWYRLYMFALQLHIVCMQMIIWLLISFSMKSEWLSKRIRIASWSDGMITTFRCGFIMFEHPYFKFTTYFKCREVILGLLSCYILELPWRICISWRNYVIMTYKKFPLTVAMIVVTGQWTIVDIAYWHAEFIFMQLLWLFQGL